MTTYRCGCGVWTGQQCDWTGPLDEMVLVEYVPESERDSCRAAGDSYTYASAVRVAVHPECALDLFEAEGGQEWAWPVDNTRMADYAEQVN